MMMMMIVVISVRLSLQVRCCRLQ